MGLMQDCSNSIANALELLQFCTKPSIHGLVQDCNNSIANTVELLKSCTNPSIWSTYLWVCSLAISSPGLPDESVFQQTSLLLHHITLQNWLTFAPGSILLTIFPSQFKLDENFILLSSKF